MVFDRALHQTIRRARQVPVLISYSVGKRRYQKVPDAEDIALIQQIEEGDIPRYPFPANPLPDGYNTRQPMESHGITHVHQFYTRRNLSVLAALWQRMRLSALPPPLKSHLAFLISSYDLAHSTRMTRMIFKTAGKKPLLTGAQSGTLYVSSLPIEKNLIRGLREMKVNLMTAAFKRISRQLTVVATQSAAAISTSNANCVDYVFVDPPFGGNLMYSELNFLWETWLRVFTNNEPEAVVSRVQRKGLPEYQHIMERCFQEFHRLLKPGRWMTMEFHNSQNAVWNAIQEALLRAGFMVADVRTFNKQQGTFKQVTTSGAVRQDLIISAYKPNDGIEERFKLEAGTPEGAWDFVRQHLARLPVVVERDGVIEVVAERQPYLLFDRMVAFHIQRGATVPLSAAEFYAGLDQRFVPRDGMFFLPDQVPEYDRARLQASRLEQLSLFVSDEKSAIQWLRQQLDPSTGGQPQTYQDLQPKFLRQLHQAAHEAMPEVLVILEQNFLQDEAGRWYVPDPGRATDLERLRQKTLLREFAQYVEGHGRLRQFRTEAVRAGFADAWRRREYANIIQVAGRLEEIVLQEDPELLMYYDNATLRMKNP
jgi:hypothetical protein